MRRPVVIDANSVIMRAVMATALDDLKAGGIYTGGIYGSLGTLKSIISSLDANAGQIVAFFDNGVPPRRMELLPDYKSARKERSGKLTDEEMDKAYSQIGECFELWPTLGIQCLSYKDREADDCVAAAVGVFTQQGHTPLVLSSDKDLWQLCIWGAEVWNLKDAVIINEQNFEKHTDVPVHLWLLYRALIGDASDSIKGIHGCGSVRTKNLMLEIPFSYEMAHTREDPVAVMLEHLRGKPKLMKHEQNILAGEDHIRTVLEAIDLERSFGSKKGLRKRLADPPPVDRKAFLRHCRRLSFESVLGDPDGYLGPFERAAKAKTSPRPLKSRPMSRRSDMSTSHEAAAVVRPELGRIQRLVLDVFREKGPMTARAAEGLSEFADYGFSTIRKRISELASDKDGPPLLLEHGTDRTGKAPATIYRVRD